MTKDNEWLLLVLGAMFATGCCFALICGYSHNIETITISEKAFANGYGYVMSEQGNAYTTSDSTVWAKLKVGSTYAVSISKHWIPGSLPIIDNVISLN